MDKIYSFSFESRTWTTKQCRKLLPPWTFGHAIRRKRSIFAFGSTQGEFGLLEVPSLLLTLSKTLAGQNLAVSDARHCAGQLRNPEGTCKPGLSG